jgi:ribosomal protein L14
VKRIPVGLAALVVLAVGATASACNVAPSAASVNGTTISVASLNAQLANLTSTRPGQCLLSLNAGQALDLSGVGTGGAGTFQLRLAAAVLDNRVYNLLAGQYLAGHAVHITNQDRSQAESTFASILGGEIGAQAQQAAAVSGTAPCVKADGSPYTGTSLLAALPAELRDNELANQATEQYLLAKAARLSPTALGAYYVANPKQFVTVCASAIETTDQATADTAYKSLKAGIPLARVAAAAAANPAIQTRSGQAGCTTEARVLQQLQVPAVTAGQPLLPVQSNGIWVVYTVTSRTPVPLIQAAITISQILTRTPANQRKATATVLGFARTSSVEVNPQYGSWTGTRVATPNPPKAKYLLPFYATSVTLPSANPTSLSPATGTSGTSGTTAG